MVTPITQSTRTGSNGTSPILVSSEQKVTKQADLEKFQLLDQVFRIRAADEVQTPLMAFPVLDVADFEYFTGKDLNLFTDQAAWHYTRLKLRTVRS